LADRHQQLEAGVFGRGQQQTVGQAFETRVTSRLAVVADEGVTKTLVDIP
jgi:hypothetical protein